jgi:hypothetical protein
MKLSTPTPRYANAAALLDHRDRVVAVGDNGDACRLCRPTDPSSPPRLSLPVLAAFHLMQGRVPPSRRAVNPLLDSVLDIARVLLQICQFVRGDDLDPDVVARCVLVEAMECDACCWSVVAVDLSTVPCSARASRESVRV